MRHNATLVQRSMASLEWLRTGDRITLELTAARTLKVLLNSEDMNISFANVATDIYVVVELQGAVMAVQVTSAQGPSSPLRPCSLRLQDSLELGLDPLKNQDSMLESIESESLLYEFSEWHGKNIHVSDDKRSAGRVRSYNQAMVCVTKPLMKGHSISVSYRNGILYLLVNICFFFLFPFLDQSRTNQSEMERNHNIGRGWHCAQHHTFSIVSHTVATTLLDCHS